MFHPLVNPNSSTYVTEHLTRATTHKSCILQAREVGVYGEQVCLLCSDSAFVLYVYSHRIPHMLVKSQPYSLLQPVECLPEHRCRLAKVPEEKQPQGMSFAMNGFAVNALSVVVVCT